MSSITWTNERRKLSQLIPWPRNPRQIKRPQVERLQASLEEFGQVEPVAIGPDGELYNGHQRLKSWMQRFGDIEIDVRVSSRPLSEKEREKLTVFLHKGGVGEWDFDALANEFEVGELVEWGFSEKELGIETEDRGGESEKQPDDEETDLPPVLDYVFGSDNDYGIPSLDISLQPAALEAPIVRWGQKPRHERGVVAGTLHFYTEDYKFNAVWKSPFPKIMETVACVIEPNYSTNEVMPFAVACYGIFRKRWLARFWQACGKRVIVDLNVDPRFDELNLCGVPRGWRAYSTRFYADFGIPELERQFRLAEAHAGTTPLFVVIGGGKTSIAACQSHGWVYVPQENHTIEGR